MGGCGTVTPGLEDECCVNLGYEEWNSSINDCVGSNETEPEENDSEGEPPARERREFELQQIIQAKNRLHHMIQQANGTCPERCVCTGSAIKCTTADGNREMIIRAGKSGNTIVQVKNTNMSTMVRLFRSEDGEVYGVFGRNQTKKIILPDQVSEVVKQKLQERIKEKHKQRKRINLINENITLNEDGSYQIQAKKKARLFWIVPVKEKVHIQIDAETGAVIKTRYSWWGFLARDVREDVSGEE